MLPFLFSSSDVDAQDTLLAGSTASRRTPSTYFFVETVCAVCSARAVCGHSCLIGAFCMLKVVTFLSLVTSAL